MAGCNGLAGIRDGIFDPCVQDAGDPVCLASEATASSTSSSSEGTGGSRATTGGSGGFRSSCGNGVVEPGEECDDGSPTTHGCTHCKVDCGEPGAFKDPATAHCYWVPAEEMSFFKSSVMCQSSTGGRLATVTSAAELAQIATHVTGPAWIGASALGPTGELQWLDEEPWSFVAWGPGEPSLGNKDLCVALVGTPLLFGMDDCALTRASVCERTP
jgi:hypothetical protein